MIISKSVFCSLPLLLPPALADAGQQAAASGNNKKGLLLSSPRNDALASLAGLPHASPIDETAASNLSTRPRKLQYYSNCGADEVGEWIGGELQEDPVDEYFLQGTEYPSDFSCSFSESDTCETIVYRNVNITAEDPLANATSYVLERPCTRCNFEYENDELCFDITCDPTYSAECLLPPSSSVGGSDSSGTAATARQGIAGNATMAPTEVVAAAAVNATLEAGNNTVAPAMSPTTAATTTAPTTAPGVDAVQVCALRNRYDSFSSSEYRDLTHYYCQRKTAKKVYEVTFLSGVANVRNTKFVVGDALGNPEDIGSFGQEDEDDKLDTCEYIVDGEPCNSCRFCGVDDFGAFELDCSNIRENAVTSCDSFTDAFIDPSSGYFPKLLVLQEGYVHADTEEPTVSPTMAPFSPTYNRDWNKRSSGDSDEGGAGGALVYVLVAIVVIISLVAKCARSNSDSSAPPSNTSGAGAGGQFSPFASNKTNGGGGGVTIRAA